MDTNEKITLTVQANVNASVAKVWAYWNAPEHITKWCAASPDWHAPNSTNDLRTGGTFSTTMAAKDGSFSFDFGGTYSDVEENKYIAYAMGDGREVKIWFEDLGESTKVTESFDAETQNPIEMQQGGWQAILDNFKSYTENN